MGSVWLVTIPSKSRAQFDDKLSWANTVDGARCKSLQVPVAASDAGFVVSFPLSGSLGLRRVPVLHDGWRARTLSLSTTLFLGISPPPLSPPPHQPAAAKGRKDHAHRARAVTPPAVAPDCRPLLLTCLADAKLRETVPQLSPPTPAL